MSFLETLSNNKTDSFYFPKYKQKILNGARSTFLLNIEIDEVICIIDCSKNADGSSGMAFTKSDIIFNTQDDAQIRVKYNQINKVGVGKNAADGKSLRINHTWEIDLTFAEQGTLTALLQSFRELGSPSNSQTPEQIADEKTQVIDLASLNDLFSVSQELLDKVKKDEVTRNYKRDKLSKEAVFKKKKQKQNIQKKEVSKVIILLDQFFKPIILTFILISMSYLIYKYRFTLLSNDLIDFFPPPESFKADAKEEIEINKMRNKLKAEIELRSKKKEASNEAAQ